MSSDTPEPPAGNRPRKVDASEIPDERRVPVVIREGDLSGKAGLLLAIAALLTAIVHSWTSTAAFAPMPPPNSFLFLTTGFAFWPIVILAAILTVLGRASNESLKLPVITSLIAVLSIVIYLFAT